ncbi:galactitol-1-phosphate 5-dehydrogenase [Thermogymnomonas acidicola]|uniref:Galactitol-1-phosphate 5-dehydrogenase n=1 Tax=Thermogymnomonas acidicola TaxID=399579 RepID=A0AA37BQX7_9ARCH|nr:alcohol dehydrogenase catalytic domain-containing protein [Thermogymnomonas acidicola]GGM68611.1 galactitol-1-phosphate 5-dehydrogenase [Thermogymnomonas acidicola]
MNRSLVWTDIGKMEVRGLETPPLRDGWVRVRSEFCGICGSELSAFLGQNELRRPPSVMGHEFAGEVVEVSGSVDRSLVGQKVAVNPLVSCGKCRYCRSGLRNLCIEREIIGVNYPGGFAETVDVPAYSVYRVRDTLNGSFSEPLATALRAVRKSGIEPGDRVLIIGAGTIGLFALELARKAGADIVAVVEKNAKRAMIAREWGADLSLPPEALQDRDFDVAIDAVGFSSTRRMAVERVRRGGTVVFLGLHEPKAEVNGNSIVRDEVSISGSFCYSDEDFSRAVDMINRGTVLRESSWYRVEALENGQDAFRRMLAEDADVSKTVLRVEG